MIPHFILVKTLLRYKGDHCWLVELLLLLEGVFITCFFLLQEISLSFLKRFYLLFLLIERIFFVCSLIFF